MAQRSLILLVPLAQVSDGLGWRSCVTQDLRAQITQRMAEVGGRLRVKSALNPALWLCAVVTVPLAILATVVEEPMWLMVCLVVLAFFPPVLAAIGFVVFLFRDPDKLQSEEYQIRKRTLEMIGEKGQEANLVDLAKASKLPLTNKDDHG